MFHSQTGHCSLVTYKMGSISRRLDLRLSLVPSKYLLIRHLCGARSLLPHSLFYLIFKYDLQSLSLLPVQSLSNAAHARQMSSSEKSLGRVQTCPSRTTELLP